MFLPWKGDFKMATITSMARQTATMYSIASKGLSYGQSSKNSSITSLWGRDTSSSDSSYNAGSALSSIYNSNAELSSLLKEYDKTKEQFNKQFSSNMTELGEAASKLKTTNFAVNGATDEDTEKNIAGVVDNVSKFVKKFNNAVSFLNGVSDTSAKISNLANSFSDSKYFSNTLNKIGITVNSEGTLKVNEDQLKTALKENPTSVESILGKSGLAGRADDKVRKAKAQQDNLFPTAAQMMGTSNANVTYSVRATTAQFGYSMVGNLLNMYF